MTQNAKTNKQTKKPGVRDVIQDDDDEQDMFYRKK